MKLPTSFRRAAFSLVEVTLALGVVSFGLVAVIGILPVALTAGRTSVAQTRATEIADTVFAGLRAQPFTRAVPGAGLNADGETALPVLDLSVLGQGAPDNGMSDPQTVYAVLKEAPGGSGVNTDSRQLRFAGDLATMNRMLTDAGNAGASATGYEVTLRFNNHRDVLAVADRGSAAGAAPKGRANRAVVADGAERAGGGTGHLVDRSPDPVHAGQQSVATSEPDARPRPLPR